MHFPADSNPATVDSYPDAPRHGFQGNRGASAEAVALPAELTVAVSRETGARGGTIGRRVARKLDWSVYDQELLEYMAQDAVVRQSVLDNLTPAALAWVDAHLQQLLREQILSQHPAIINLAQVVLALGSTGKAVLIGRGAGCILPRSTTLNVRLVAPIAERIGYISQWQRLSEGEAAERVRQQDLRRAEFISTHFHSEPGNVYQYDLVLNSSLLGEETCTELIALAARERGRLVATRQAAP
jgi:cytidylate kinase